MQKGVFIETVLLRINGGVLTDEAATQRVDIEAHLPASVNWAMGKSYNVNFGNEGDRDYPSLFYGSFTDLPIVRTNRIPYITLPKGTIALYGNQGIRYVKDNCGNTYTPLSDSDLHTIEHYSDKMLGSQFFRLKQTTIDLYGINPLIESLNVDMIVRVEDLDYEDELPIEGLNEKDALQVCYELTTGIRQNPADRNNNKVDINTA